MCWDLGKHGHTIAYTTLKVSVVLQRILRAKEKSQRWVDRTPRHAVMRLSVEYLKIEYEPPSLEERRYRGSEVTRIAHHVHICDLISKPRLIHAPLFHPWRQLLF